ncbi:hypothetical protein EVAR_54343_1 [Eumeta japonica]|uniref:Uncharacterized protein n=1 Tax=Eumeta variegata TaxID=151549 RepID=A0A4C1Y8E5_EUMVA|nr:hypothetical protein EVAR_54343_1 [Eumeta japonica]
MRREVKARVPISKRADALFTKYQSINGSTREITAETVSLSVARALNIIIDRDINGAARGCAHFQFPNAHVRAGGPVPAAACGTTFSISKVTTFEFDLAAIHLNLFHRALVDEEVLEMDEEWDKVCLKENNSLYLSVCLFVRGIFGAAEQITMRLLLEANKHASYQTAGDYCHSWALATPKETPVRCYLLGKNRIHEEEGVGR